MAPGFGTRLDVVLQVVSWLKGRSDKRTPAAAPDLVTIGTVETQHLAAAIRVEKKALWQRWRRPAVDTFLQWVPQADPYCRHCQGALVMWHHDFRDYLGLECPHCDTKTRHQDVEQPDRQMRGQIRRHYADYWLRYQQATYTWLDWGIVALLRHSPRP